MSFFDFGPLFDPRRRGRATLPRDDDEPVIIDIETNGDEAHAAAGSGTKPPTGAPRITRQAKRPSHGRGSRVLIAVVAVIAVVVALFFAVANFATDVMWYSQLGFQSMCGRSWARASACGSRMRAGGAVSFLSATLAIHARPAYSDGSTIRIHGDMIEVANGQFEDAGVWLIVALVVGVMFGSQFNANWTDILLMFNAKRSAPPTRSSESTTGSTSSCCPV